MAQRTINIGVIGLGFMGRTHVAALQLASKDGLPGRLTAVCDRDAARLSGKSAGGNLQTGSDAAAFDPAQVTTATDPEALITNPDLDALCICTHTDTHVDLALRALRAGKHVLVEKPVALLSSDVQRIADAATAAGKVAMPAMCMRFWPGWAWLRNVIRTRDFGPVRSATFQRLGCPPTWTPFYADTARSGGPFFDLHIHDADFVRHAFGEPTEVTSTGTMHHVTTIYRFAGPDAPPHVIAEGGLDHTPNFGFRMRYIVNFERATADWDLSRAPTLLLHREGRSDAIELPPLSAYDGEVRHFIEHCAGIDPNPPRMTMADAVRTTALLEAEKRSMELRAPVRL